MGGEHRPAGPAGRCEYLDFVKCAALILMEIGHCIQCGSGTGFDFFGDNLFRFIYSFHMPLFMLVSGYVFYWSFARRSPGGTVRRQLLCLALPAMCWTLLYQAVLFRCSGNWYSLVWMRELPAKLLRGNWFCWSVFWCSMLAMAVLTWERQTPPPRGHRRMLVLFFISALLPLLPNSFLQNGYMHVYMYPYFALGYAANYYDLPARVRKHPAACFTVCLALFAALLPFYSNDAFVYTTFTSLLGARSWKWQALVDGYRWAIGLFGSLTALYVLYGLWRWMPGPLRRGALWVGRRTLALYILSPYLSNHMLAKLSASWQPSYALNVLEAAVMLAVSAMAVYLLEGWRWTRRLLLGHWDG